MVQKLKELKLNRYMWLGIIIVEIILGGFYYIYSEQENVTLNFVQEELLYDSDDSGYYLDKSYESEYIATPEFTLPKGLYTVEVQYERSDMVSTTVEVVYTDEQVDNKVSNNIMLLDSSEVSCDFRVKYNNRPLQVRGRLTGDSAEGAYILLKSVHIKSSNNAKRNVLFRLTILFLVLDILLFLYTIEDRIKYNKEYSIHFKVLMLLICFSSIPLMLDYMVQKLDLPFHLTRIVGLKESISNHMFPVRIQSGWLFGHGYAVSVFYGDFFLYIPAFLCLAGVSIQTAYQIYVLFINTLTVFISYHCFSKISNLKIGLVCTTVYTLNVFRLYNLYYRAGVGEYTAMTFLPLVLYGVWKMYMLPEDTMEHKRSWITLTLGCSGVFLSHMFTTEMTALFLVLTGIILWKKTFRKKTLLVLLKTLVVVIAINSWFLIPFLDYMVSGTYYINYPEAYVAYQVEYKSLQLAQLFNTNTMSIGFAPVGLVPIVILAGWFLFCMGKKEKNTSEKKHERLAVFLCFLSFWMSTRLFPYSWLAEKFSILKLSVRSMQFSWRFFVIVGLLFTYLLCLMLNKEWIKPREKALFAILLVGLSLFQGISYMSKYMSDANVYRIYSTSNLSMTDIGEGEYLPIDPNVEYNQRKDMKTYMEAYVDQLTYEEDSVCIEEWHRERGAVIVSMRNYTNRIQQVEVPLLLYKGYHAITGDGKELAISPGKSYRIAVSVPADFSGNIKVVFREPWYWRICEIISLFTAIGIIIYIVFVKRTKCLRGENTCKY